MVRTLRLGATLVFIAVFTGCSFFLLDEPSTSRSPVAPRCETSRTIPAIDLTTGGVLVAGGVGLYALLETRAPDATDADEVRRLAVGSVLAGAVYLIAGVTGLGKTRRCRAAKASVVSNDQRESFVHAANASSTVAVPIDRP